MERDKTKNWFQEVGMVWLWMGILVVSMYASGYYQGRRAVELEAVGRGLGRLEPRGTMGARFVWVAGEGATTKDTEGK